MNKKKCVLYMNTLSGLFIISLKNRQAKQRNKKKVKYEKGWS